MSDASSVAAAVATAIDRLAVVLEEIPPQLLALTDAQAQAPAKGMRWSRKELIGHLIDSAGNNHQRFVRAQYQERMSFPRYVQDEWIGAQAYRERPWSELVELWRLYNRHLLHVMRRVPPAAFGNVCTVAADEPETLGHHMADYVQHMDHHLRQALA
jgi:DinB superfamily